MDRVGTVGMWLFPLYGQPPENHGSAVFAKTWSWDLDLNPGPGFSRSFNHSKPQSCLLICKMEINDTSLIGQQKG
jgi:hypothetical protein